MFTVEYDIYGDRGKHTFASRRDALGYAADLLDCFDNAEAECFGNNYFVEA